MERTLKNQIKQKRSEVKKLEQEIVRLEIDLRRAQRAGVGTLPVSRSTSIRKMAVENVIIERLGKSVPPETDANQLWPLVSALGVTSRSTFRSHLRRMKEKGLLIAVGPSRWRLHPDVPISRRLTPTEKKDLLQVEERYKRPVLPPIGKSKP